MIAASPERADPPCPHFGTCGGCTLQHWQEVPYRAWKAGLLEAALRRAGYAAATAPLVPTPPGARRRMDFALRRQGMSVLVGLHAARAAEVVDLYRLPGAAPRPVRPGGAVAGGVARAAAAAAGGLGGGRTCWRAGPTCCCAPTPNRTPPTVPVWRRLPSAQGCAASVWARGNGTPETPCLLRPPVTAMSGVAVRPPPGAFLQANRAGEAAIIAAVLAGLPEKLPARARVAELYAGCGTLTFALASRARVAAYEGDADLVGALAIGRQRAGPPRADFRRAARSGAATGHRRGTGGLCGGGAGPALWPARRRRLPRSRRHGRNGWSMSAATRLPWHAMPLCCGSPDILSARPCQWISFCGRPGLRASLRLAYRSQIYTWKLSPQPQRPFSFGLVKVKPAESDFTS